jgi:hypothetical protein
MQKIITKYNGKEIESITHFPTRCGAVSITFTDGTMLDFFCEGTNELIKAEYRWDESAHSLVPDDLEE